MSRNAAARIGQPGEGGTSAPLAGWIAAASIAAVLLAALGGAAVALVMGDPRAGAALAGLADHPWWLTYRTAAGDGAAVWSGAAAAAMALLAAAALLGARRLSGRGAPLAPAAAGLYLLSAAFESLRGATAFLVATDRSIEAALFLCRVVWWARFTGLLALLLLALYALELPEQRPAVVFPVVLVASLAVAASVPVDRTAFLAQLTFRLGDERGVLFANLVIGALAPLSVAAGAVLRRERRLGLLAAAFVVLLAARELVFFGTRPIRLTGGLACFAVGSVLLLESIRRGHGTARDARGRPGSRESSAR